MVPRASPPVASVSVSGHHCRPCPDFCGCWLAAGYTSSARAFADSLAPAVAAHGDVASWWFISGVYSCRPCESAVTACCVCNPIFCCVCICPGARKWNPYPCTSCRTLPEGVDDEIGYLLTRVGAMLLTQKSGNIDVLLGHSQGGYTVCRLLGAILKHRQQLAAGIVPRPLPPGAELLLSVRGVVLMASSDWGDELPAAIDGTSLQLLAMLGRGDRIVSNDSSLSTAGKFCAAEVVYHDAGHSSALPAGTWASARPFLQRLVTTPDPTRPGIVLHGQVSDRPSVNVPSFI